MNWFKIITFLILCGANLLDIIVTYHFVCLKGGIELNPIFTQLAYKFGYIIAVLIERIPFLALIGVILWKLKGIAFKIWYLIVFLFFILVPILCVVAWFQHIDLPLEKVYQIPKNNPETFDRQEFCQLIKFK